MSKVISFRQVAFMILSSCVLVALTACDKGSSSSTTISGSSATSSGLESKENFLYVGSRDNGFAVNQYKIEENGNLVLLDPPSFPTEASIDGLIGSSDKRYLYGSCHKTIYQWSVAPDGTLTSLNPPTVESEEFPGGAMAVLKDNLYVGTQREIIHFKIGGDGTLGRADTYRDTGVGQFTIHPSGKYLYASHGGGTWQYSINEDGSLLIRNPKLVDNGAHFVLNNDGSSGYSAAAQGRLVKYVVGSIGLLKPEVPGGKLDTLPALDASNVADIVVDKNNFVHAMVGYSKHDIITFFSGADGIVRLGSVALSGEHSQRKLVIARQNLLYVSNYDSISAYELSSKGEITPIGTFPAARGSTAMVAIAR
jgi:6-phosphogluconolactonase (cycloisomerase 2 family)